jgi:hypothetical protein
MARLFKVQTTDRVMNQLQDNIANLLEPTATTVEQSPLLSGTVLEKVVLTSGSNTIRHTLGRVLKGWFIVRQRASATLYDTQDSNSTPQITLLLTASANVTVDIYVF